MFVKNPKQDKFGKFSFDKAPPATSEQPQNGLPFVSIGRLQRAGALKGKPVLRKSEKKPN